VTHAQPDWHQASCELATQCHLLEDREQRVKLLETLCAKLGDALYPCFLQMLCILQNRADESTKSVLTEALVLGLTTGRVPAAKIPSWGSSSAADNQFRHDRCLGPVEFLCVWYSQSTSLPALSQRVFNDCMQSVLSLLQSNKAACEMYCQKLKCDLENTSVGQYTTTTHHAMTLFCNAWENGKTPEQLVEIYTHSVSSGSPLSALNNTSQIHQLRWLLK